MITSDFLQAAIDLLTRLIPIVLPVILARVYVWAKEAVANMESQLPDSIRTIIEDAASFGADFAHQVNLAGMLEQYGKNKKEAAITAAEKWLKTQGYDNIDLDVLADAIEVVLARFPDQYKTPDSSGKIGLT